MLRIRPATLDDAPGIARVHVESWRTSYGGIVPDDVLAALSVEDRTRRLVERMAAPTQWSFVAVTDADEVVGFVAGGEARHQFEGYDAELYAIYLLKEHQGGGLGKRLVYVLVDELRRRGYKGLYLWALRENAAARGFYEKLGGTLIGQQAIFIGQPLIEVAYGWSELDNLWRATLPKLSEHKENWLFFELWIYIVYDDISRSHLRLLIAYPNDHYFVVNVQYDGRAEYYNPNYDECRWYLSEDEYTRVKGRTGIL